MPGTPESLVSRIPPELRLRAFLIILGVSPGQIPKHADVTALTARRVASGESKRPNDPRRLLTVKIMSGGLNRAIEARCVKACVLLRNHGHETAEIQAALMTSVRRILEYARDLGKYCAIADDAIRDDAIEDFAREPSALGDYLAGVDGAAIQTETGA